MQNVGRFRQWDTYEGLTELQAEPVVHDVVHHPQRGLGDMSRKLPNFNAVELVYVDDRQGCHVQLSGFRVITVSAQFLQDLNLQGAQLTIGNDKKIATATGRVEKAECSQTLLKAM